MPAAAPSPTPVPTRQGEAPSRLHVLQGDDVEVAVDTLSPHWIATDERGRLLLDLLAAHRDRGLVEREYAARRGIRATQAWLETDTFLQALGRVGFDPTSTTTPYLGREHHVELHELTELWIHLNDACNLKCTHCLVGSAPGLSRGLPPLRLAEIIDQAATLGVRRFLFTGGEPLARQDIIARIGQVTRELGRELIILTNGTLVQGRRLQDALESCSRARLQFQVSVDGPTAALNDEVRGSGSFEAALGGIDSLVARGFAVTMTVVAHPRVLPHLEEMADLAARHRVKALHVLWPHRRGRAENSAFQPDLSTLVAAYRRLRVRCQECAVTLDNDESMRARINGLRGVKTDLSNACWESLCVYTDESVYPSAATAGIAALRLGSLSQQPLEVLWRQSTVARIVRAASVVDKAQCATCPYKFLCGGGDIEHAYFHAQGSLRERLLSDDPYSGLYQSITEDLLLEEARRRVQAFPYRSGFNRPVVAHAMGEDGLVCGADQEMLERFGQAAMSGRLPVVRFARSACVLSVDVVDRSRRLVEDFYGHAAAEPQAELCCPIRYDDEDTAHIPAEVLERFYGCGGPMSVAQVQPGETVVDLGSGGGTDCFIAARKTGANGRVIGIDMTDAMLEVARGNQTVVAERLGWDVVTFRKGLLEAVPVDDRCADLVTSNCVINLSPDKTAVFREMWRMLADHGRIVVSDIVSEREVPPHLRFNPRLWGECISGALSEAEFLALLERAGFFGISILTKRFWKEVEGHTFHAITVRGYKFEKTQGCVFIGQRAAYLGPLKAAVDEEGHLFPRGEWVEVCTDTASKLRRAPYSAAFVVAEPGEERQTPVRCDPSSGCC